MRRLLAAAFGFACALACAAAHGQAQASLESEYSHIQDLNNAGSAVVYAKSPTEAQLHEAIAGLEHAQTRIAQLRKKLATGSTREYVPVHRAWNGPSGVWKSLGSGNYSRPRARHYDGPVVVLIGPRTISAAEDFVVSFEAMKRGILVGRKTAGSTGQPLGFKLPGGGFARICTARDTFPDGRTFVGEGIAPQVTVTPTVADIRAGRDPAVAAAVVALRNGKAESPR